MKFACWSATLMLAIFSCTGKKTPVKNARTIPSFYHTDESVIVYASNDTATIYAQAGAGKKLLSLKTGDSLVIECDPAVACDMYYNEWYKTRVRLNGEEITGYIWGWSIGAGNYLDIDDDGKDELVIYGYNGAGTRTYENPAFVKAVKNNKLFVHYRFKAYSDIYIGKIDAGFDPHIPVLDIKYGLGACDYPNYDRYVFYRDGKLHDILESVGSGNEYAGIGSEFVFPSDSAGKPNTILEYRSLQYNTEEREPGDTDRFDTTIYEFRNYRFNIVYQTKHIQSKS